MGASIIARCDAPPVLDPAEHVFDPVSLPVERFVVVDWLLAVAPWRDAGLDPFVSQSLTKPVSVIAAIGQQVFGVGQTVEQVASPFVIADLTRCEEEQQGPPRSIGDCVQLGIQAAFGASDTAGKSPFFSRLAAVLWAFRCVASIIKRSGWPALPAKASKMRLNTPMWLQRMKRL